MREPRYLLLYEANYHWRDGPFHRSGGTPHARPDRRDGCFRDVANEMPLADAMGQLAAPLLGRAQLCRRRATGSSRRSARTSRISTARSGAKLYGALLLACFEREFPDAVRRMSWAIPPSDPGSLIDDMPRREAHLARFLANGGETAAALARLDAALRRHATSPLLLAAPAVHACQGRQLHL